MQKESSESCSYVQSILYTYGCIIKKIALIIYIKF